jgi:Ca-activated chloride channel family protein
MLLILLMVVGLLSVFMFLAWRKRQRDMGLFVRARLLPNLTIGLKPAIQKLRMLLLVASVACVTLSLARPQWGYTLEELKQSGLDIVVALDTSRSMSTQDLAPNRMARAKLAALELMPLARTDRLGLVAFAGTAFLQCPLTVDDEAYRQSLNLIDVGFIPQGGTAIGEAIRVALKAFKEDENNEKAIILITDGEDHEEGITGAMEAAEKAGVRIFTIGVGTTQGELIPIKDEKDSGPFVKDEEGNMVKSHLNEALLQRVAKGTQGFYLPLQGANTMDILYERGLAPLLGQIRIGGIPTTEKRPPRILKHFQERFQWPLGAAITLLIIEVFLPVRLRFKRRTKSAKGSGISPIAPIASGLIILLTTASSMASSDKALDLYNGGRFSEALKQYQQLQKKNPKDERLPFNAGTAAYQAKEYERAISELEQATTSQNLSLQENAYYNLGNAYYRLGEKAPEAKEKTDSWKEAMKNYESALKLNPQDKEAKNNAEFVKKALEELKKQPQQQSQDQNKDNKNQDKKDDSKDQKSSDANKQNQKTSQPDKDQKSQQDSERKKPQDQKSDKDQQGASEQKPDSGKKEEDRQKPGPSDQKDSTNQAAQAQSAKTDGKMSPQQARQLLDSQKEGEKAMNFVPQQKTKSAGFKDW